MVLVGVWILVGAFYRPPAGEDESFSIALQDAREERLAVAPRSVLFLTAGCGSRWTRDYRKRWVNRGYRCEAGISMEKPLIS